MDEENRTSVSYCPHCGNTSVQTLLLTQPYEKRFYGVSEPFETSLSASYNIVRCETCSEILLYSFNNEYEEVNETMFGDLVYPKQTAFTEVVPEPIRTIYYEAVKVKNMSPIAFVVLARRVLEEISKDRGIKKQNLADAIQELTSRGEIPAVLSDASALIRMIGNAGAHASDTMITMPQIWAVDDFLKAIIEYLYVAPAKVAEFKNSFSGAKQNESND